MSTEVLVAVCLPSAVLLLAIFWAWQLCGLYYGPASAKTALASTAPKVAVILPLRGADPSLSDCVSSLVTQRYPSYEVYIILDHERDPARAVVEGALSSAPPGSAKVYIDILRSPGQRCSLKVSALLQAISHLSDDFEIIVFADADSAPGPDWLASLVVPFEDQCIGAVSGIRWFAPPDSNLGTLVRYIFNAAAIPQMRTFGIPWGGSLALRRQALQQSNLVKRWECCYGEDTSLYDSLKKIDKRIFFAAGATLTNTESTDLPGAYQFILRQVASVRLNHANWRKVMAINITSFSALIMILGMLLMPSITQQFKFFAAAILVLYFVTQYTALIVVDAKLKLTMARRLYHRHLLAIFLTLVLGTAAIIAAQFLRKIRWRGITYAIEGRNHIRMVEYLPFTGSPSAFEKEQSI
jgi:cellulose synthase/poly-beta-1,6-N-acetylglucosamine synthase-like glycosyltransferase